MAVLGPTTHERPDRVQACPYRHTGECGACGFDGTHRTRTEQLEAQRCRARCTCSWRGPIRRGTAWPAVDGRRHRVDASPPTG